MAYTTLISTQELAAHIGDPNWVIIDCRFVLSDPPMGRQNYLAGHIPGAIYAHLDDDLSSPIIPGETGRHPLPVMDDVVVTFSRWGIDENTQVVAYDDAGGLYAGRLWWMLRWLGHDNVALLDGDWRKWAREGRTQTSRVETGTFHIFTPRPRGEMQASVDEVLASLEDDSVALADARDEARYRGEVSGMDPVAGHSPGAYSAYFGPNLNADGTWRSPAELRARFEELFGDPDSGVLPDEIIFYCGSGVSAAHDVLAMQIAGLGDSRLYVGSWSHWITDPDHPVATG